MGRFDFRGDMAVRSWVWVVIILSIGFLSQSLNVRWLKNLDFLVTLWLFNKAMDNDPFTDDFPS
jgi:hypothetical protein